MKVYLIYGITDCPACLRAQADLMEKDIEYVFIEADFSKTYRAAIKEEFGWPTFPIVVMAEDSGETLIGGYSELWFHLETDDIDPKYLSKS